MGLENESCKFDPAISLLRDFVNRCTCRSCSVEEASTAIQVLREIFSLHTETITQLQTALKELTHGGAVGITNETFVKKEINCDFNNEASPQPLDDKDNYFDDFNYMDTQERCSSPQNQTETTVWPETTRKKHKKKKDRDRSKNVGKMKKHGTKERNKLKNKSKLLVDCVTVVKTEKLNGEVDVTTAVSPRGSKRRSTTKHHLSRAAKAKLQMVEERQHRDEHHKLFGKKYQCAVCAKSFAIKTFLERHMAREHGPHKKEVQWECDECGKFYASKRQLERHKLIHRGEKSFQCEICGRGFDTYDTRYIHQFVHTDNKYICDCCGKVYRQRRHLVQHMKNHNGYIWKCKDCGKVFDTQRKWLYHKKNHSGNVKKKQCDICGATFAASSSIRNHMMIHLGHKPYQCSQCDMSFVQAGGLRTHEKTHNNTSRCHRCQLCGKMMTSKGLAYHLMVHQGSRPYKCDKCSKAFVTDFKLRKHKKIHLRLGHYKSEEEAGILRARRKSIPCLNKEEGQLGPSVVPSASSQPPDPTIVYPTG